MSTRIKETRKNVSILIGLILSSLLMMCMGAYNPPSSVINNLTVNDSLTIQTNLTVKQNIKVSGHATFNDITVTNQLLFTTNRFPLSPGTTWNLTKPYQFIATNDDFVITAISGLTNNLINWGDIEWSNSDSATHFCDLSTIPWHIIGSSTTNKVYLASHKTAFLSALIRGMSSSNLVTAVEQ